MKVPVVVTAIALALGAVPLAGADQAQPRGGGSSHGGSGSAAARHPSSHGGGSSGGSQVSGGHDRSSGTSGSNLTTAQRRHPRPGTGTGHRGRSYRGYPYYWYSPGYYGSYGYYDWWYGPGWYSGAYYPGYAYRYGYRSYDYDDNGALRLLVHPEKARVYVDGYYAGVVDDFDGLFQRLNLPPGRHEISFKLEGYKTHRVRLYVPPDQTLKIRYDLAPGDGEDSADEALDRPGLEWADRERERTRQRDERSDDRERDRYVRRAPGRAGERDAAESEREPTAAGAAVLSLSVRPEQAAVYVDGAFRGTGRDVDDLDLPPGRHRVEVVAPGFKTFDREVEVKAGATETLSIELERP